MRSIAGQCAVIGLTAATLAVRTVVAYTGRPMLGLRHYRMFAGPPTDIINGHLRVRLIMPSGHATGLIHPRQLMNLDAGVASACFTAVFRRGTPQSVREQFCRTVLTEVNQRPWRAHGEVWATPMATSAFTGIQVVSCRVDLTPLAIGREEVILEVETIYACDDCE